MRIELGQNWYLKIRSLSAIHAKYLLNQLGAHHFRGPKNTPSYYFCVNQYSYLWTYDLYGLLRNAFDAGKSITRASGRGLGPGKQDFFGPCEMLSSHQASAVWDLVKSIT